LFKTIYLKLIEFVTIITVLPVLFLWACACRFLSKKIDIGIGPEPMINNAAHSQALRLKGYTSETFTIGTTHITDKFDYNASQIIFGRFAGRFPRAETYICSIYLAFRALLKYRCVYQYFYGGALGMLGGNLRSEFIKDTEPWFYKASKVQTVVMPYGSDVHLMRLCNNFTLKNARSINNRNQRRDEIGVSRQIDRWSKNADHIIGGCDWVDYIPGWDSLMLAHFAIDVARWKVAEIKSGKEDGPVRILHAPNHRILKGTEIIEKAVDELNNSDVAVELVVLEQVDNDKVKEVLESVDIVVDQLVVGWYAMFALEGMAMGKPVICYIRPDLLEFYRRTIIGDEEFPIVEATPESFKDVLHQMVQDRGRLSALGEASREFVLRHHSLDRVGNYFDDINRGLGIVPYRG